MNNDLGKTEAEIIKFRQEKISKLEALHQNPYPAKSFKNYSNFRVVEIHKDLIEAGEKVFVAGRISAIRGHGKLSFVDINDSSGKLQLILRADELGDDIKIAELLDIGDFIEAHGGVIISKSGEVSVLADGLRMLSKSVRPMPSSWYGLKDDETRMRKRYLELAQSPDLRELFVKKSLFWNKTREFLSNKGFLEVETPVLEVTAGGADASPFITHHDALDIDVFLRISMGELWQKRLLVGGFDKTFEIGRQFRNEGISREHLQDYSQMEFYWAYANYEDSMALVEELYKFLAHEVFGTYQFNINNMEVDLNQKWEQINYTERIKKELNIDVLAANDAELVAKIKELKLEHKKSDTRGRMIDTLWKSIRGKIAGPAFLVDHPVEVSPLAKRKSDNPKLVERYQIILGGTENGNGYSELNDPADQRARFEEQASMREGGDVEAQMHDADFVEALEYGMPPASGFGFSERLFATFVGKPVRECVLFPLVRPEATAQNPKPKIKKSK
ncbi:MAG: Lysine--tRNA ligase [bacterium ADurb.Bin212]|nr:MAG: Lysine--tRNA ligase [bacterium ADurb.Bin212]